MRLRRRIRAAVKGTFVVNHLSRLLAVHRHRISTRRGSRPLGPFRQAVLVLRCFRERGCVHCMARDVGVFQVVGHRLMTLRQCCVRGQKVAAIAANS
ncbi:hypothetical protein SAMN05414137_121169 [Streptacidiphilus jiangxiensis]|uniref:Uncharacterized protein n=1 Tax=Streptacidiphilus jiangxiensis TaxID=235985 RepID=A0A1H7WUU0_STRJI|nr:hypothetical protein SAMN05414137_121169 [Streptacidiphilus jiangxiensis]